MTEVQLRDVFDHMASQHVVVIGDVMLDNYWWGEVERISPEAPVPVVTLTRRESRLGGAANVALNSAMLGAQVTLASVIGNDANGAALIELARQAGIRTDLLLRSDERPTTTKTRVISRNQQMLRLDDEITAELTVAEEHPFLQMVLAYLQIHKPQIVIFEDYNKGVLKENVIQRVVAHCRQIGALTAVDPKQKNFLAYRGVNIFKPNLKEVREGLHLPVNPATIDRLDEVHDVLAEKLNHQITFITLSEKGVYYNHAGQAALIPAHVRNIADVSGAGDTVIATAALAFAATRDAAFMAALSNLAGGLVCEQVGVVPINRNLLWDEAIRLMP